MNGNGRVEQLLKDDAFLKEVECAETTEDVCACFASHGVSITEEQLNELVSIIAVHDGENELNEEMLDSVAGGGGVSVKKLVNAMVKAAKWGWNLGSKYYDWEQKFLNSL